jgi:hypothetical protein
MKKIVMAALLLGVSLLAVDSADARRVVVRKGGRVTRVRVTVRPGFPIRRTLPNVVVRPATVRVAPRVYLAPVAFTAVALAASPAQPRAWSGAETLDRDDGWTDFTIDVDRRGGGLLLEIDRGTAQVSFAEVVFENGEAQVVDFNDRIHATGVYSLIDFKDGRKVDHVRVVAKADSRESVIRLHLLAS